jgi:hypothetical protein
MKSYGPKFVENAAFNMRRINSEAYYTMPPWAASVRLRPECGSRERSAANVVRCFRRLTCRASDCVMDAAKGVLRSIWFCQFLEADLKTSLPRKVTLRDEKKLFEMVERGGVHLSPAERFSIQKAMEAGRGGIWLELSEEQYAKLKRP